MTDAVAANKANIARNRAAIFNAENTVMENRSNANLARSLVQENQALIQKNYAAAFHGNRQLVSANTADLFRNRYTILQNVATNTQVEKNFKEAKFNEAKITFLENQSKLNTKVLDITLRMAAVNAMMIEINHDIMQTNEEIVQFNSQCIEDNGNMIKNGVNAAGATPESNATLIASNSARIEAIRANATDNSSKVATAFADAQRNKAAIDENTDAIYFRRTKIQANHERIRANQALVSKFVSV